MEKMTVRMNEELNGIEVLFDSKPSMGVLSELKDAGFKWHRFKKLWYAKQNKSRLALVEKLQGGEIAKAEKAPKQEKKNKFGVEVGDIFSSSWGYEQTNVDFFQVVELVGATMVRVREVVLPMEHEDPTCSMAADRYYKVEKGVMYPATHRSVFIKDNEKGDLKKIRCYSTNSDNVCFTLSSFANAYKETSDMIKVYESWYY